MLKVVGWFAVKKISATKASIETAVLGFHHCSNGSGFPNLSQRFSPAHLLSLFCPEALLMTANCLVWFLSLNI